MNKKLKPEIKRAIINEFKKYKKKLHTGELCTISENGTCYCAEGLILKALGYVRGKVNYNVMYKTEKSPKNGPKEIEEFIDPSTSRKLNIPTTLTYESVNRHLHDLNDHSDFTPGKFIKLIEEQW